MLLLPQRQPIRARHRIKLFHKKSAALILSLLYLTPLTSQAATPPTIASTSLCGDSYLLALAPDHISALSWQSRSPLSRANRDQRALPQIWDDPEVLISNDADIILFGSGEGKTAGSLDASIVKLTWGEDFAALQSNAGLITAALGISSDMVTEWTARIDALKIRAGDRSSKPKILYLSRSGGSAGSGTLVDAAITAAGGVNIVEAAGWFTPDPEQIIAYEPDLIITSYFKNGYESVQSTAIRNKTVQRFIERHPSVEIDGKLWPCAGPGLVEAAELIADAIYTLP
ncbi:MAG: ABC transporter substrate-binding protein [Hellea sp.]